MGRRNETMAAGFFSLELKAYKLLPPALQYAFSVLEEYTTMIFGFADFTTNGI
jgi:hypothetical protein